MNPKVTDFKQIRLIGRGSFSKVIEARNIKTNKLVAIKILKRKKLPKSYTNENIKQEISLHYSLRHVNIITFFGHFTVKDNIHLIMEYCQGGDVYHDILKYGTYNHQRTATYMNQMCSCLKYLDRLNIIHRDVKSENVLISNTGSVKLCDFSCATNELSSRTTFCGTVKFMAPEIKEGHFQSQSVDVWSLGLLMQEMHDGVDASGEFENIPEMEVSEYDSYNEIESKFNAEIMKPECQTYYENLLFHLLRISKDERLNIGQIVRHPYIKENAEQHLDKCEAAIEQWSRNTSVTKVNVTYDCIKSMKEDSNQNLNQPLQVKESPRGRKLNVTWKDQQ